jgi:hypothetical protein
MMLNMIEKIRESNRIEGIHREPTGDEIREFERFMALPAVTVSDLCQFVYVYQPNAKLRDKDGRNVRVGHYYPPPGAPWIRDKLEQLCAFATGGANPWEVHLCYESLHPFTDGNGRSGRMLWYWQMRTHPMGDLGFLHAFYYQTLAGNPRDVLLVREIPMT